MRLTKLRVDVYLFGNNRYKINCYSSFVCVEVVFDKTTCLLLVFEKKMTTGYSSSIDFSILSENNYKPDFASFMIWMLMKIKCTEYHLTMQKKKNRKEKKKKKKKRKRKRKKKKKRMQEKTLLNFRWKRFQKIA